MRSSAIFCLLFGFSLFVAACGDDDGDEDGDVGPAEGCPAAEPVTSSSCDSLGLFCEYPGRQCICGTDKAWWCDDVHPSCPAEPAPEVACPVDAVRCVYSTGALCFCSSGAWTCPQN